MPRWELESHQYELILDEVICTSCCRKNTLTMTRLCLNQAWLTTDHISRIEHLTSLLGLAWIRTFHKKVQILLLKEIAPVLPLERLDLYLKKNGMSLLYPHFFSWIIYLYSRLACAWCVNLDTFFVMQDGLTSIKTEPKKPLAPIISNVQIPRSPCKWSKLEASGFSEETTNSENSEVNQRKF